MSTCSQQIVVAIRPPYQDASSVASVPSPQDAPAAYWLDTSSGVAIPLNHEQFLRASRAYQSGHRRFKLLVDETQKPPRVTSLEPAVPTWGPALSLAEEAAPAEASPADREPPAGDPKTSASRQ